MQVVRRASGVRVVEIHAKSVLNRVANMPFDWSINPYQGCAHQCVFCYARATHAYRELDGVDDWGAVIYAKVNAPAVVRAELSRRGWRNDEVAIGTATDPYQSIEGRYRLTRGILEELARARTPMHLITRSGLILRDLDVLTAYAARADISVCVSIPTLDAALARELEPTVAPPAKRLETVRRLAAAGIRVGVGVAPVLPALTDDAAQLAAVIRGAAAAGAAFVWHAVLNLGDVPRSAFFAYLTERQPRLLARYGAMYATRYPPRSYARSVAQRFEDAKRGIALQPHEHIQAPPAPRELTLF
ncbi:MAG: radical SAM protein [Candidatus Velthaea sp.]